MWLIESSVFSNKNLAEEARCELLKALGNDGLTVVIGNSPSRAASWLMAPKSRAKVGWEEIVRAVANKLKIAHKDIGPGHLLGLAEAICLKKEGRALLTDRLRKAFLGAAEGESTALHRMIAELKPREIVTTNYDLLIEKSLEDTGLQWRASIRNAHVEPPCKGGEIILHKMHGTVEPPDSLRKNNNYLFRSSSRGGGSDSIVIAEEDYDDCLEELKDSGNSPPVLAALSNTCLIIGKSFYPEDLSFMHAFRAVRGKRGQKPAYAICTNASRAEKLYLQNYGVKALEIPMPTNANTGHYYYAMFKALDKLLGEPRGVACRLEEDLLHIPRLVRRPAVLGVGLASMNVAGRTVYAGSADRRKGAIPPRKDPRYGIPKPGRRNMRYEAESYVGGSAMTPLMVLAALDKKKRYQTSMVSVVGKDIYADDIFKACKKRDIDIDGVSSSEKNTWYSTVLVHDGVMSKNGKKEMYPGQRIFLDRGYNSKVKLSAKAMEQLRRQLEEQSLRILYLDKFLAVPHPPDSRDVKAAGPLFQLRRKLRKVASPKLNVVYDTGGGGSAGEFVEKNFRECINIFTSSFPFFARHVLIDSGQYPEGALGGFRKFKRIKWYNTEFKNETQAIEEVLEYLGLSESCKRVSLQDGFGKLLHRAGYWAGRDAESRWFIVTLHHLGAMGINLQTGTLQYQPLPEMGGEIQNTSGAGDTFRGALCYALLKLNDARSSGWDQNDLLQRSLEFSVRAAAVRCQEFHMEKALKRIKKDVKLAV